MHSLLVRNRMEKSLGQTQGQGPQGTPDQGEQLLNFHMTCSQMGTSSQVVAASQLGLVPSVCCIQVQPVGGR